MLGLADRQVVTIIGQKMGKGAVAWHVEFLTRSS